MLGYFHEHLWVYYVVIVLFSMLLTLLIIPSILHVSHQKNLYDDQGHFRKQHGRGIPRLGGVAIFVSFTITSLLFSMTDNSLSINHLLTACILLFAVGLKDDLSGVNPRTKFFMQFLVASLLSIMGDIRVSTMQGVLGIYDLPYWASIIFSILVIIMIVNAFNLIDGIDGLASVIGIIVNSCFAALFINMHAYELAAVALAMVGAICGFLKFNTTPAKMFMGDTGSLLIGLVSAVMAIKFIELSKATSIETSKAFPAPALVGAILIVPLFDTARVFVLRILKGKSPFSADRNHIHHRILSLGFTHLQTTLILAGLKIFCIYIVLEFKDFGNSILLASILLCSLLFNLTITFFVRSKERGRLAFSNLFI